MTFPAADTYDGFDMHEDGIGMARTFMMEFAARYPARSVRKAGSSPRSMEPQLLVTVPRVILLATLVCAVVPQLAALAP